MKSAPNKRSYVMHALDQLGAKCPERYVALLETSPADRVIAGLRPWAFDHDPESAVAFCSEAAGRSVLPFAQAIGEDMMACFKTESSASPGVIVINPWAEDKTKVVLADLPDFEAWLAYAQEVSRAVQAREKEESDDE